MIPNDLIREKRKCLCSAVIKTIFNIVHTLSPLRETPLKFWQHLHIVTNTKFFSSFYSCQCCKEYLNIHIGSLPFPESE